MLLMFVSECSEKALLTTRRILDCYATRNGVRTWTMNASKEAESIVRNLIDSNKSRQTSVACFTIDGFSNKQTLLRWISGKQTKFTSNGRYAFRSAAVQSKAKSNLIAATVKASSFAGFTHDIGKNTVHFSGKLKKKAKISDAFRHETLSYHLMHDLIGFTNASFIKKAESLVDIAKNNESALHTFPIIHQGLVDLSGFINISHHRLPSANYAMSNHIKMTNDDDSKMLSELVMMKDETIAEWPAIKIAAQMDRVVTNEAARAMSWYGRLGMMLADHYVSSTKEDQGYDDSLSTRAVRRRLKLGKSPAKANGWQPLDRHLQTIGTVSGLNTQALLNNNWVNRLPHLTNGELVNIAGGGERYQWQIDAVKEAKNMSDLNGGFIGFLMAGTGCGKTVAYAAICGAIQPEATRMTVCLGLRSLTLQTGDEYESRLGLDKRQMSVLIGSHAVQQLHHMKEESDNEVYLMAETNGSKVEHAFPSAAQEFNDGSDGYLTSPVLVTTVDNLINAADWRRSKWIRPALRLMSAPLVLDEIDQYDTNDIIPIVRLVFIAGLCGQKVILSSATLPSVIAKTLHRAYAKGYAEHAALYDKDNIVAHGFFSEHGSASGKSDINDEMLSFTDHVVESNKSKAKPRIAELIKVRGRTNAPKAIAAAIVTMHNRHAWIHNDLSISAGLVRIANVKDVAMMAVKIGEHDFGTHRVLTIPYHARMPLALRSSIEKKLDVMLKRSVNPDAPAFLPEVADAILKAKADGCTGLSIVVVASPVEEVGRDHCFDWAILEPSSLRSLIQCCGRVMRHRNLMITEPNIAILQYPLKDCDGKVSYCRPGLEIAAAPLPSHDLGEIAEFLFNGSIHSGACLMPDDYGILAIYERDAISEKMKSGADPFIDRIDQFLTEDHFSNYQFRTGSADVQWYYDPFKEELRDAENDSAQHSVHINDAKNTLFTMSLKDIAAELAERLGCDPESNNFLRKYMSISVPADINEKLSISNNLGIFKE